MRSSAPGEEHGLPAHLLMAAPSLEAARYRACAARRACIRSAHRLSEIFSELSPNSFCFPL
jgi:hypothetical protein